MACETMLKPRQTLQQRKAEVKKVLDTVAAALVSGRVKVKVDKATGGVIFDGLTEAERDGVSDACVYRGVMSKELGSAFAAEAIKKAEMLAGRKVDAKAVATHGLHSHDHGKTWHTH